MTLWPPCLCFCGCSQEVSRIKGHYIRQVMNITDLDDKTIRASQEQSVRMKISGKYLTTRLLMKRQKYLPYQRGPSLGLGFSVM